MLKQLTAAALLFALSGTASAQDLMGNREAKQIIQEFKAQQNSDAPAFEAPKLNIGDEAPALKVNHWAKGAPISEFEKGNVYLVDFWATWCGPCIAIMPHLTELEQEHEADGLRVVGVSIWERKEGDEHAKHVDEFVQKNDERMGYTVATGTKTIEEDWMRAANQNGIPTVFIVDREGKIGWIGYGTDPSLGESLEAILKDEHDYEEWSSDRLESMKTEHEMRTGPDYMGHFQQLAARNKTEAGAFGQAILKEVYSDNPGAYNMVAWTIVENEGWSQEAVEYARKIAKEAVDMTDWENPAIIDTLAWAHYRAGDAKKAAETQMKAIELLDENDPSRPQYVDSLETFKKG